jgi:hypothetical protein
MVCSLSQAKQFLPHKIVAAEMDEEIVRVITEHLARLGRRFMPARQQLLCSIGHFGR